MEEEAGISSYADYVQGHAKAQNVLACLEHPETLKIFGDQHMNNIFHMSNVLEFIIAPRLRNLEILGRTDSRLTLMMRMIS